MHIVTPPPAFSDRTPGRGPFISPEAPPAPYTTAQLLFENGSTYHATWCPPAPGRPAGLWWGWCNVRNRFCEVHPLGWREMERERGG